MPDTNYLITLKPRGRFFFGGDRAFTASGEAVYAAESLYFPQQTALLGMLRYAMIRQDPNAKIGTGFDIENNNWGDVSQLSPVFLIDTISQKQWRPVGMNFQKDKELQLPANNKIENYDPKNGLLINSWACGDEACAIEDFFQTIETVGNKKARDGKSEADGFFKQKAHQLKRPFGFAFYATFKAEQRFDKVHSVIIGADQSVFGLNIAEAKEPITGSVSGNKIVLLSDAYLPNYADLQSHCDFILGTATPFRYMTSPKGNDHFANRRSLTQFNLLSRGSVLYPKTGSIADIINILQQPEAFRKVGYNHFKISNQ